MLFLDAYINISDSSSSSSSDEVDDSSSSSSDEADESCCGSSNEADDGCSTLNDKNADNIVVSRTVRTFDISRGEYNRAKDDSGVRDRELSEALRLILFPAYDESYIQNIEVKNFQVSLTTLP